MSFVSTDVVIIGAGPAGTTCGFLLKKAAVDCVLIDHARFPREKICGGGLTPKAYHLLAKLMPDLRYEYQPVRKMRLLIGTKVVSEIEPEEELRVVNRKDFDLALLQQYLAIGGELVQGAFLRFDEQPDGRILVTLKSGQQYLCHHLIGADGANSRVRHQLIGDYRGNVLAMEQYVPKGSGILEGSLSSQYCKGYYYRFPGADHDVVGYVDKRLDRQIFKHILKTIGVEETDIKGAYIPVEEVESGMNHVILIGDAGGFPNKVTYEGLYYAIVTGLNASRAVIENRPFKETNSDIFRRKRRERLLVRLFYSRLGMILVRLCSISPRIVKRIYEAGV